MELSAGRKVSIPTGVRHFFAGVYFTNLMRTKLPKITLIIFLILVFFVISSFRFQPPIIRHIFLSPAPTYDPLVEPPLPANPTELDLGENLYWHWCMTCHGDKGQGLTDEFRGIWEPEHQNCWARGCHTGRRDDLGFPIPTIVPAVVSKDHLAQFPSIQSFADFLKATHPPQSPGILKNEEYQAIALFVFSMNGRSPDTVTPITTKIPVSTPTATLHSPAISRPHSQTTLIVVLVLLALLVAGVLVILVRLRIHEKVDSQSEDPST